MCIIIIIILLLKLANWIQGVKSHGSSLCVDVESDIFQPIGIVFEDSIRLKITQRIQYKILSLTYKSLQYNKPSSISDLLTVQPTRSTRSSAVVTLQRPPNPSRLKISDRSFYFQAPALWNALAHHLRSHSHSSQSHSLLSLSSSQFHKQLKTHLFSSFLSSLAYLLSTGLTPWNFDSACLSFIIHSISFILDPFICSTRFNFMFVI